MKKFVFSIFIFIVFAILFSSISYANEIDARILLNDSNISPRVTDDDESTYIEISSEDVISISSDSKICGLYIIYEVKSTTRNT